MIREQLEQVRTEKKLLEDESRNKINSEKETAERVVE